VKPDLHSADHHNPGRADLRFPQRISRRRQQHRHRGLDAGLVPKLAVLWAAFFNFAAAFLLGTAVAKMIGGGMIHVESVTQYVVITGLFGAIVWDLLTWWWGLPTSSSHALIGGYAGAAVMRSGWHVIIAEGWYKTLIFIVWRQSWDSSWALHSWLPSTGFCEIRPRANRRLVSQAATLSAAAYSLGHGGNDAQKTMGIVASALYGAHYLSAQELAGSWGKFHWPIILAANASIALGTYFGGWRIVHTMGSRITKLKPVGGFCAEAAGAITLFSTALAGIPVSTTHTITGAIVGVGAVNRLSAVRWGVARRIVWAWVVTIPAAALVAAGTFWLVRLFYPAA
jgi:inorganic phosphate transporter, PiT family